MRPVAVVFDVDGTLLASAGEHHRIIVEVLARRGLDVLAKPWAAYRNYTDSAVIDEVFEDQRGRGVSAAELAEFDAEYLAELLAVPPLPEVPGARRLLADLGVLDGVHVAFATGSLRAMAQHKLATLGVEDPLLATGGEHRTREAIVTAALDGVRSVTGSEVDAVVLGDGIWDERTAVALGLPFVAVQTGPHVFGDVPVRVVVDLTALDARELVSYARPVVAERISS